MPDAASEPLAEVADLFLDLEVNVSLHGVEADRKGLRVLAAYLASRER